MSNLYDPRVAIMSPAEAERQMEMVKNKRAQARRNFLKNVGLAGAGIAAGVAIQGCGGSYHSTPVTSAAGPSETDVLNFALNLEYLEAEFYSYATTGSPLSSSVTGGTSTASGGSAVKFVTPHLADIAAEIANDEKSHVMFLRNALGGMAVPEPVINLSAMDGTEPTFLALARAFEDTGVSADGGAATLLTGNNLQYAAQILAVEAYHAGNLRLVIIENGQTVSPTDSEDVPPTEQHFFPVDSNALALIRTTSEVLAIAYGNSATGTSKGGFFPNGVNGNINTV